MNTPADKPQSIKIGTIIWRLIACAKCEGTGRRGLKICCNCDGDGRIYRPESAYRVKYQQEKGGS